MRREDLKQSKVVFKSDDHTYWLNGKELSGITGVINRQIFPDKYKGVSEQVLANRASFGTAFHKDMEFFIETGIESSSDLFRVFKENYSNCHFIASEYIVTDGANYASPIDAIDENGILYDFKTSTKKDIEYWRWQLGVYCYLFELQNGYAPSGCRVLWINKDLEHDLVDITPVDRETVARMLACDLNGERFLDSIPTTTDFDNRLAALAEIESEIIKRENALKAMKEAETEMKEAILEVLPKMGVKSWETDRIKVTIKDAYKRSSVDSKALKDKYPDIYDEVLKETTVKQSLVIKIKEQ